MPSTSRWALPYPSPDDTVDVPRDIQALAEKVDVALAVPVGAMMMWMTSAAPAGWALCNGQTLAAATYPQLAAVLGSAGGNITLPNLTGRVPMGASGSHPLNENGGVETVALTSAQSGLPPHSHTAIHPMVGFIGDSATYTGWEEAGVTGSGRQINSNSYVANADPQNAAQAHTNLQPYLVVNYIIRVG